ncbi:replication-relaxation family protein [Bradyrhizobium sediminis]|uniref:Replication-relaxation family protein n=1 Tax=Bradyrhizobium sediminis TaxID=2840469 RepID=A0A975NG91_9BRAD|nr:replication-relaxation family protein [Bradyrhizobium sediminis]QWG14285.1 replication-relaxation family protein [Bradyrhizobium sediminis]
METLFGKKQRVNRFRRTDSPRNMRLTERDLNLIRHVAKHRFLTTEQLQALDGGSQQNVSRALRALYDHGYLDRPGAQIASIVLDGPKPTVHALGKRGAQALRERGHKTSSDVDWTEKNKRAGAVFIEHTLERASFMTAMEIGCREKPGIELLDASAIIAQAPEPTRRAREPLRWVVERLERGRKEIFSVVPDGLFGLSFPDETASYFLLEIDRGTIPLRRTDTYGTAAWRKNIEYKFRTYYEGWRADRHMKQFGVKQLRVVWVTSSQTRLEHMLELQRDVAGGNGSAFFLFADNDHLRSSNPLDLEWVNGKGELLNLAA